MTECLYFNDSTCRSCELLELSYQEQLTRKFNNISQVLGEFSGQLAPFIQSELLFNSRSKAKMVVGGSKNAPLFGYVTADFKVIDITSCPLHVEPIANILSKIKEYVVQYEIVPYDIATKMGELKYVIIRQGNRTKQSIVRFVTRSKNQIKKLTEIANRLLNEFEEIEIVSLNIQPIHQAIMEGEEEIILSGSEFAVENMGGNLLAFGPQSFSQVTPNVSEKLYSYVASKLSQRPINLLLDLYCGVGAFSIFAHKQFEKALGIEISVNAIENAIRSAELNQIRNIQFEAADVESYLKKLPSIPDAIVVNPPRRGLGDVVINQIKDITPNTLIYSSCNPATLVKDLRLLCSIFKLESLQPFDMFPLTNHAEVVATLVKY